ncbi:MAG: SH3 domain-containing protein [Devosia sp.]
MNIPNLAKVFGLGGAVLALTAGTAFAATSTASVNVRTGPGTQYRVVDTLRAGEQVALLDQSGSWCAIDTSSGNGWVSCRYLSNDRSYRERSPSVSIQLGFGTQYPQRTYRPHRPMQHDGNSQWDNNNGNGHWDNNDNNGHWSGPRSSTQMGSNGYFGLSIAN